MSPADVLVPPRPIRAMNQATQSEDELMDQSVFPVTNQVDTSNLSYLEGLYHEYLKSPDLVSAEWREYFAQIAHHTANGANGAAPPTFFRAPKVADGVVSPVELEASIWQERVDRLIRNFRAMGHFAAKLDPLERPRPAVAELELDSCGFTEADLDRQFSTVASSGPNMRTLRQIVEWLRNTYCRSIGVQFMHIDDLKVREWLQNRMEATENRLQLPPEEQRRILKRLSDAVVFEDFILKKFKTKTFSLEGAETLIPLLDMAIYRGAEHGVEEVVLGMAHRGRLNVLTSIMGKSPRAIFREFADLDPQLHVGRGDVKYHLGYSNDWHSGDGKKVHLSLCFNPSHLEFVNPVAMGRARAKQDRKQDKNREKVMLLLIHGDAAFAGEGVVQEQLNLCGLDATKVGGTVHVIVNNQIGFTTDPTQGRSTQYCSDVAKMLQIPIFHVNGEDPEAVAQVVALALDFRHQFQRDVVIDMYCYRFRGHNEQDEPDVTQPLMYKAIRARKGVVHSYFDRLKQTGGVSDNDLEQFSSQYRQQLESELEVAKSVEYVHKWDMLHGIWTGYKGGHDEAVPEVDTGVDPQKLSEILTKLSTLPPGFTPNPKIHSGGQVGKLEGVYQKRMAMARGEVALDWGAGEALALGTLAAEGHRIRLHGQDVERGTFTHRHAVIRDYLTEEKYCSLQHLSETQGPVEIHNSALSETAVLGFDYGYSLDTPEGLIMWEAQFGDFVNVAQVIIDQFIVSAEDKWNRLSGLVLLLPHGFEGNGPEHSSARLERFLTLCAEDNIQVCYPSTPVQIFHLLRRQVIRKWRKPLVVMTPKVLLRLPAAVNALADFGQGTFRRVLPDTLSRPASDVRNILLCSGKVYYDLAKRREELQRDDIAILRLEQLYPTPTEELVAHLAAYPADVRVTWVQEEPENNGAWRFLRVLWGEKVGGRPLSVISRPASASPATGSHHSHDIEQEEILTSAIGANPNPKTHH